MKATETKTKPTAKTKSTAVTEAKKSTTTAKPAKKSPTTRMVKPKKDAASDLRELFVESLKDIYWAEKALTKALPKMAKNASTPELKKAFTNHLSETEGQVTRLEQVFSLLGKKAVGKKCDAMEGLLKEADGIMEETEPGIIRDAGIIGAAQKVEHYEIATYGTLHAFATSLGETEVAEFLAFTLEQEKNADSKLTDVALSTINFKAAEEVQES